MKELTKEDLEEMYEQGADHSIQDYGKVGDINLDMKKDYIKITIRIPEIIVQRMTQRKFMHFCSTFEYQQQDPETKEVEYTEYIHNNKITRALLLSLYNPEDNLPWSGYQSEVIYQLKSWWH